MWVIERITGRLLSRRCQASIVPAYNPDNHLGDCGAVLRRLSSVGATAHLTRFAGATDKLHSLYPMFRRKVIYVQVYSGYFIVRLMGEDRSIRKECAALAHPRTLAGDFNQIQAVLASAFREVWSLQMSVFKPHALIHLVPKVEGGYTNIELRAFKDAAEGAGAKMGWMCTDKYGPLTDQQLSEVFGNIV